MGAPSWAASRNVAEQLRNGAIAVRALLLDKTIPPGGLDPVLGQCKRLYLELSRIRDDPSASDLDEQESQVFNIMVDVVLAFSGRLSELIAISDDLDSDSISAIDKVPLRRARTTIRDELLDAIGLYIQELAVFLELAGRHSPERDVNEEPPSEASA
jgi:hypothetical protein